MKNKAVHGKTSTKNAPYISDLDSWIPDMPPGPLDKYRKSSRFNWKLLQTTIEDPDLLRLKNKIWKTLQKEEEFQHPLTTPSVEEQKRRTTRQLMRLHTLKYDFITPEIMNSSYIRRTKHFMALNEALAVLNRNLSVKFALGVTLFGNTLPRLGTDRHLIYWERAWRGELLGCFAITEIAHGSNTKAIRTTATYDPKTEEFVIHTPDFEAAKCWVGNLGRTCTYALVFAQLLTADGEKHGLHGFVVPIRNPVTLLPYPGITVGDMGEKNGLNGIDNGFVLFNQYRIAKDTLLNKTGDIGADGSYETSFTNPQQILGAALEAFTTGRVAISQEASLTLCCAVTIAVRYAAVRRQFGPQGNNNEIPILEYPLHQWRLFPYLAAAVIFRIFIADFVDQYLEIIEYSMSLTEKHSNLGALVGEIHAIVSSCKPLLTWVCRDALQECREACGGHGYLRASNLGDLRTDHDPSVTYEGDNNVLIQQTSNWLLRQSSSDRNESRSSPFNSVWFLDRFESILNSKFVGIKESDVLKHEFISGAYEWLLCWLIRETDHQISSLQSRGVDKLTARAQAQVYKARTLSLAFAENNALTYTWRKISKPGIDPNVKIVLEKLYLIYGLRCIDKHLSYFYQAVQNQVSASGLTAFSPSMNQFLSSVRIHSACPVFSSVVFLALFRNLKDSTAVIYGGFAEGPHLASLVREGLITLCSDIVPDSVAIVDAISPPDFALNSVLAHADGNLYENLKSRLFNQPGALERASWWKDAIPAVSKL